jgi:hypothetical protein
MGSGDILGLGGVGPSSPRDDIRSRESSDSSRNSEEARRRRRMNEGADELVPPTEAPHHSSGATGIDMGSGGEGTDIE